MNVKPPHTVTFYNKFELQKAMATVVRRLKWLTVFLLVFVLNACDKTTTTLSQDEKKWLQKHPNLIVGISTNEPPYEFINEKGETVGIFIDFLNLIEKRIDYKFKKVYQSDFPIYLKLAKEGKIDVLLELQKTPERESYLNFTAPLLSHDHVIIVGNNQNDIKSIDDLKDKKIAVVNLYAVHEYLTKNYPDFTLVPFADNNACLKAVATGQVDAFVAQQAVTTYIIETGGFSNLKMTGKIDFKNDLAIATIKSRDTLNTILSKAVNSISYKEKKYIYSSWLSYEVEPFYKNIKFWLSIVGAFLLIIMSILFFNKVLSKQIKKKTVELYRAKKRATENEQRFQLATKATNEVIWEQVYKTKKIWRSENFTSIFGWDLEEIGDTDDELLNKIHPDDREKLKNNISQFNLAKDEIWEAEYRLLKKDGTYAWVNDRAYLLLDNNGTPKRVVGSMTDITKRKSYQDEILLNEKRLKILINILQFQTTNTQDFLDYALNEALELSTSTIGYIYYYDENKKEFRLNSWSNGVMKECLITEKQSIYELDKTGIWGEAVRQRKPIVVNDFQAPHSLKKGHPKGHAKLSKFMTIPIFYKEKIEAVIGVANKETDYTDTDVLQLSLFMDSVWNVVKRKKLDSELMKLSSAVNQSPVSIIITDINGKIEYANPKTLEITGYELEELIGENPRIFSSGEKSTEEYRQLWINITTGKEWQGEFHNKRKNGELFWEHAAISPLINSEGVITHFLAVKEDITAKKRAEQVQNIILNIANASQTNLDLEELMQVIQQELGRIVDTKNFFIAFHNETNNSLHIPYYQDTGGDYVLEFPADNSLSGLIIKTGNSLLLNENGIRRLINENGIEIIGAFSKVWLGIPLKIQGKARGVFVVQSYEDENAYSESDKEVLEIISQQISISIERKRYEVQIKLAKEKAEENDRLKTAFLTNLSHEIRTPMNSIIGFSDLLMNQELSVDKQEKYHEIVNASGKRLMNLINDIVDISKIDAHELILSPSNFNLNALVDQLHQQFLISPKNINTSISTVKYLKDEESFVHCDETRLVQVLSNLLENALKFTHNGTVEFGYRVEENQLHFYVKDSGVGINAKDHQHIFERFGQSNNEILKVKDGSGLGLAISKGIVELFGGTIWVESEPHKGATFHFTIPNCIVKQEEKSSVVKPIENTVITTIKTILVAEDEETNFWYLEAALDGLPFKLIHKLNGKEAVEAMQTNNNIDLILMDFNMPVMNGLDATKEIRKTQPTIPIIAVTAYAMMADKEKALEVGCTDYLSKPVSKSLLLETINRYVSTKNPH